MTTSPGNHRGLCYIWPLPTASLDCGLCLVGGGFHFGPPARLNPAYLASTPEPATGDETWAQIKLRELLPDLLIEPRDELQALFARATGRRSLTSFFKAFRPLIGAG